MKRCRFCGQDEAWCSVYTSCPLSKGGDHSLTLRCLVIKGKQMKHQFVFDGAGPERHCLICQQKEETE